MSFARRCVISRFQGKVPIHPNWHPSTIDKLKLDNGGCAFHHTGVDQIEIGFRRDRSNR